MKRGDLNIGIIGFIVVALIGAAAYGWYSFMYKPAVQARTAAKDTYKVADAAYAAAKSALDAAIAEAGNVDKSALSKTAVAKGAIPRKAHEDLAFVQLDAIAKRTGVEIDSISYSDATAGNPNAVATGAKPIDMTVEGEAKYWSLASFAQQLQELVDNNRGKLYVRGRIMDIVSMDISRAKEGSGGTVELGGAAGGTRPGYLIMKLTLRIYAEGEAGSQAAMNPLAPATPAAGAPAAGAPAAGTDAAAGAAAPAAQSSTETVPAGAG